VSGRRRTVEVFSLAFLDCICCGFGAIILLLVLTEFDRPARLETSRVHLQGQVRELQQQLEIIRGESSDLQRQLQGRTDRLQQQEQRLSRLAGDLTQVPGEYSASRTDAAVTNTQTRDLVAARQKLSPQMQRVLKDFATRPPTEAVGGIPIDSEYLVFVIDTSDSMTSSHWDVNLRIIGEILGMYPRVLGLQVMNDQGIYLFPDSSGSWLQDSPQQRAAIAARARYWHAFSQSNPVPGIEEAVRRYRADDKRVSVFVLGDEFTGASIQAALDAIGNLNRPDANGRRPVRIHAIGFPEAAGMAPYTSVRFAALMRLVCTQNNGTFLALQQ
jgi:hypothetical protein